MKKQVIVCLSLLLLWTNVCFAGQSLLSPSPYVAVAVHIDTTSRDILGVDFLESGINRLIQAKFSLVMMDGMVLSGNSVLKDLKKSGIDDFNTADLGKLKNFGQTNDVAYVLLLTLHPLDVSADMKAFDVSKGDYIIGKKITQPKEAESKSGFMDNILTKFTLLIDSELDDVLKTITKS
ncbi:hypothetical protein [Sporomusa malonica]|uniref:Uncharacterized protein n=1 Tax=Sporomusa malonica TaxID=112901 RepID=A0A1W2B4A9_9FIRM|nr:hypothetical protein [Sporomusa malonica]SMC67630.1 hypothetical protein SAMN04488500_106306 [Sporomusa malonica]